MTNLTEQQVHLQNILEQRNRLVDEINKLNNEMIAKRELMFKVQGVAEYLESIGVTLNENTNKVKNDVPEESATTNS